SLEQAFSKLVRSWAWKKFITGSVILLPIAITFCVTWWFIRFVDSFFSPIYALLGIDVFGASVLSLGEWFINKMPFVSYIYSASKQISTAISPDQNSHAFKEVAIIRHPRNGEYAFGFITSTVLLRGNLTTEELCCVYVPTNHLYLGDIYLISSKDVMRPNLSVREGIGEIICWLYIRRQFSPSHFRNS
ncbi:Protein LIKE COV 3, partial [Linum perenne]